MTPNEQCKEKDKLQAKIDILKMLDERECNCDKARMPEHFLFIRQLKYEYETKLQELEDETK